MFAEAEKQNEKEIKRLKRTSENVGGMVLKQKWLKQLV